MMTERRRDGCTSKIFLTVFQGKKEDFFFFWLYWCDLSQLGNSGVGLEALAGAETVHVSPGTSRLSRCAWCSKHRELTQHPQESMEIHNPASGAEMVVFHAKNCWIR